MSHVHNWTVLIGSPRGRAEMQPADITQAENEGGTVLRKQIRAPYLKNADKQDPEMPTTLGSEPEPGSWHESEREGALSVGTQGMESGPPGLQTFPIGTTSFQNLCNHCFQPQHRGLTRALPQPKLLLASTGLGKGQARAGDAGEKQGII